MTNRDQYIQLCLQHSMPLHAQAWWLTQTTIGKEWDVCLLKDAEGRIEAAMPYLVIKRLGKRAILMPIHSQYQYVYVSPTASADVYERLAQAWEELCHTQSIGWVQLQGFYPEPMLDALRKQGYTIQERVTYRIEKLPAKEHIADLFSENKRRQLRKAKDLQLRDLSVDEFYAFQQTCWATQGKHIDYPLTWAKAVLTEALQRRQGRLLTAQDPSGDLTASLFLAWDDTYAYYLLPAYRPDARQSGVAWLTEQALQLAQEKGLAFDFEGSMTPSIASSYRQFGGKPVTYHRIEKFYNPLMRIAIWLRQRL